MILPDVNVLVYAFRREAPDHGAYATWLQGTLARGDLIALADPVLTGFLRIVTNPRVMADPAPLETAIAFTTTVREATGARSVAGTRAVWARFHDLCRGDHGIKGNVVPDAWIAALAQAHGCQVATRDRGFRRFAGVSSFDPVDSPGDS